MLLQDISISKNLQRLRKRNNLSQAELAVKLQLYGSSLSSNAYSKIERGTRNIKLSDLILLKIIYDVSFDEFFKDLLPENIKINQ